MGFLDGIKFMQPASPPDRYEPMRRCKREAARLIEELLLTQQAVIASRNELLKPLGLSNARAWLLKVLLRSPVRLTVADCARRMGRARQSTLRLANELERLGHLRFVHQREDRRSALLELTASGHKACSDADVHTTSWLIDLSRSFDEKTLKLTSAVLRTMRRRTAARHDIYVD